ncbi:YqaI family protein [Domibacillus antri]|uniref:YqaI family protein n=1 Tax=Domibacillus antri TaxID=1714264 RepID=UPI0013010510|nr:hypothetical protein [Domibacillus antri]
MGIDCRGDEVYPHDYIWIKPNGEVINHANISDYLLEEAGFKFMKASEHDWNEQD